MRFNSHSRLEGQHAFLSPSYYHWLNYTPDKLSYRYRTVMAALLGSEDHAYAAEAIELQEMQINEETTLGMYINDCIRYRMTPEQPLFYSRNCFGTADAISYRHRKLRIFDLKTGVTKTSVKQLEIYVALFCLEYGIDPFEPREMELRIYQNDEVREFIADPEYIRYIMDTIIEFDVQIDELRLEDAP